MRFNFRWRRTQRGRAPTSKLRRGRGAEGLVRRGEGCRGRKADVSGRRVESTEWWIANRRSAHGEGKHATGAQGGHMRTEAPSTREAARLLLWKEFAERSAKPCAQGFWPPTSLALGTGCCGPNSVQTLDDRSIT